MSTANPAAGEAVLAPRPAFVDVTEARAFVAEKVAAGATPAQLLAALATYGSRELVIRALAEAVCEAGAWQRLVASRVADLTEEIELVKGPVANELNIVADAVAELADCLARAAR